MPALTLAQLAAELTTLITESQEAAAAADTARMRQAHSSLRAFIERSGDSIPGVKDLDALAARTMRDLTLARLRGAIDRDLAARDAEIVTITKKFRTLAERS